MKKHIGIIGSAGLPAKYGGWETLVTQLIIKLAHDFEFTVYCSSNLYKNKIPKYKGANLVYIPFKPNRVQSILYDLISMIHALFYTDKLLVLGVSGCVFLPILRLISKKEIIVCVDGIEWKRAKWGRFAKWFLRISENAAVKYANIVVSDNIEISKYLINRYNIHPEIIAYGGDQAKRVDINNEVLNANEQYYTFIRQKYAFCVCRIEPENNLDMILKSFQEYTVFPLVVVGNWDFSQYGRGLKNKYNSHRNIHLLNPIYNQRKIDFLRSNAYLYVHGHSVGGTNPSLVEAMNLALPILCFDVSYNRATTFDCALYFRNKEELIGLLESLDREKIDYLKEKMHGIAKEHYTWFVVSEKYKKLLLG